MMSIELFSNFDIFDEEIEEESEEEDERNGIRIIDDDKGVLQVGECIGAGGDRGACVYEILPEQLDEFGVFSSTSLDPRERSVRTWDISPTEKSVSKKEDRNGPVCARPSHYRRYAYKLYPESIPPAELSFLNHVYPEQYAEEEWEAKILFGFMHLNLPHFCVRIEGVMRGLIMPRYTNSLWSLMESCNANTEEKLPENDNNVNLPFLKEGAFIAEKNETGPHGDHSNNASSSTADGYVDLDDDVSLHRIPSDSSLSLSKSLSLSPLLSSSAVSPPFPGSSFLTTQRYQPIRSIAVITALAYQLLTAIYCCNHMVPFRGENGALYSGYTHNDIHLPNLLLNEEGRLALCDFELVAPLPAGMIEEKMPLKRTTPSMRSSAGVFVPSPIGPYPRYSTSAPDPPAGKVSSPPSFPMHSPFDNVCVSSTHPLSTPPTPRRHSSLAGTPPSCCRDSDSHLASLALSLRSSQTSPKPPSDASRKRCPPLSRRSPNGLFAANADVWAFGLVIIGLLTGVDPLFSNEGLRYDFGKGPLLRPYHVNLNCVDWEKNISRHIDYLLSCRSNTASKEEAKDLLNLCSLCLVNAEGRRSATAEELLQDSVFERFRLAPFLSEQIAQKWINENFQSVPGVSWN